MKKYPVFMFLLILVLLLGPFSPQSLPVQAQNEEPDISRPYSVRLPRVGNSSTYTVSGKVTDSNGTPIAGVTITSDSGETVQTNNQGNYTMNGLWTGPHALSPSKSGMLFNPSVKEVNLSANIGGVSFTGSAFTELIINGGFEETKAWTIPVTEYTAGYSLTQAHTGTRSMRTGIVDSGQNKYSYSAATQKFSIASTATHAQMYIWLYPQTTESTTAAIPDPPQTGTKLEFSEATDASDAQYVLILDSNGNTLETLVWMRSNNRFWTQHTFDLTKWKGRTIQVHIGSYNDGGGGVTALYADDVSVLVTSDSPPPPVTCANSLSNSSFEDNWAWSIPITAWSAGYSTTRAHTGSRSMRTGIVELSQNRSSFSDAWQYATIPTNVSSAKLKVWFYRLSGEVSGMTGEQTLELPLPDATTLDEFYASPQSSDAQYMMVLDTNGNILQYLFYVKSNASSWQYTELDLMKYKGQTIRLQFGTYNDGIDGVTTMYVDDMYADYCTGTPPPPPTSCTNLIVNGKFDNDSAWYIPLTNYSAGYSTALYRSSSRSMRTGIYYESHNRYSYSDARQTVTLPANLKSAVLSFWINPRSSDASNDRQYVLILDKWGNWIDTLIWQRANTQNWQLFEFGLKRFAGETIQIDFGTFNDGAGGVTSMYVDDVTFNVCPP